MFHVEQTQSGGAQAPLMRAKAVATPQILKADKAERGYND